MCRGHPKHHRCAHTSVSWYYCPSAHLDMFTGAMSPCGNPIMNDSQPTKAACPLQHCRFAAKTGAGAGADAGGGGGSWVCCQCGRGPNTRGWCAQRMTAAQVVGLDPREEGRLQATCDHGCCDNCTGTGTSGAAAERRGEMEEAEEEERGIRLPRGRRRQGEAQAGAKRRGWLAGAAEVYEGASSPGSVSEGTVRTWVSSPPSSKAGSDDGDDAGRDGGKRAVGGKKGGFKRR